jgi:xanthine dehydrogenase accessory factor
LRPATITALNKARSERRAVAFAKRLTDSVEFLLPSPDAPASLNEAGLTALRQDKTGMRTIGGEPWFIEARNPPPRLILVGAVHIAQALSPLACMAGFEVILVDPRRTFGNEDRFPGIELMNEWPDTALQRLCPDARAAIVTLTHDPKLDDPALDHALRTEAFYIGALGSRKTHTARLERLRALGHESASLARIYGPVGLDIAAATATEIALSVIAEIVAIRRGGGILTARQA